MADKKMRFLHWKNLDHFLITIVYILAVCGLISIYSATRTSDSGTRQMIVQSAALVLGTAMMLLISRIDYDIYPAFVKFIYISSVAILIFVLIFGQGKEETGANSWIRLGAVSVQPSEFVKIAFAVTFSVHLDSVKGNINRLSVLIKLFLHFAVLAGLVILQNDTGTTLVFAFMFFVMLFIGGLSFKYIIAAFAGFAVLVPVAWFGLMQPYQKERILVFLNPERDAAGYGYQVAQSKIAIGSGEFVGRGYLLGPQNQLGLLPERDTDFIFGALGEEFGFLGTIFIVTLLTLLIIRCFHASVKAKDDRGRFLCGGIAAMFMFHVVENIFMCIGLLPVTGIPLPFLSYGGSSLLANFMAVGLVLGVWARRRVVKFEITY